MEGSYDSRPSTHEHIAQVRGLVLGAAQDLIRRAHRHDRSKLEDPELTTFDQVTERLAALEYGSPEYEAARADMGEALAHHYRVNDHHPEHYREGEVEPAWGSDLVGIEGMGLLELTEMLCDWIAASRRHDDDKDVHDSIEVNAERFGYGEEMTRLLHNSVDRILEIECHL